LTIENITRVRATALTGIRNLPYGCRWYLATGIQWYPKFGDFKVVIAGDTGLQVIVGKQKARSAAVRATARAA